MFRPDRFFAASLAFVILSILLFRFSEPDLQDAVNVPLLFFGSSLTEILPTLTLPTVSIFLLSLGLVFFGASRSAEKVAPRLLLWLVSVLVAILIYGINPVSTLFSVALLGAIWISATYYQALLSESKKWKYYRTASKVASMTLLVLGAGLAAGTYLEISDDSSYRDNFENALLDFLVASNPSAQPGGFQNLTQSQQAALRQQSANQTREILEKALESSPLIGTILDGLPVFTALTVFFAVELWKIFIAPLCGLANALVARRLVGRKERQKQTHTKE